MSIGIKIYKLAEKLWPLNRSITGQGVRETLKVLKKICPDLKIKNVDSGTDVFDWKVPDEWQVKSAYIISPDGNKICDFSKNNLHLVSYSVKTKKILNLIDLKKKLYSLPRLPDAIPYKTSYYHKDWGFCISHNQKKNLKKGTYKVLIDTKHFKGKLNYGEILIKGKSSKEIFLSTYICHPSMANNELSGPSVAIYIASWIKKFKNKKYSYRIIFVPETIGSIAYLSLHYKKMKKNIIAGYNLTCLGDNRTFSYLPSRNEDSLSDKVALQVLEKEYPRYKRYNWNYRASDERQYCSPGIDLPVATVMRTKYGSYPEYHTSFDNLKRVVNPDGLGGSFKIFTKIINTLENNSYFKSNNLCEPNLSKRNLYDKIGGASSLEKHTKKRNLSKLILDILTLSDGKNSKFEIAKKCNVSEHKLDKTIKLLIRQKLLKVTEYLI
jgi:aminopeptidase-like protein